MNIKQEKLEELTHVDQISVKMEPTDQELEQQSLNELLTSNSIPMDSKPFENPESEIEKDADDEQCPMEEVATVAADEAEADDEEDDEEEEDEEDEVTITINDVKGTPPSSFPYAPVNLNITKRSAAFAPSGQVTATSGSGVAKPKPGFDIDAPGQFNGQSIYDVNLDTLDDKPWRKPGADITDYFNYGFTEDTWKIYCERQKRLRGENGLETELGDRIERGDRERNLRGDRERLTQNSLQRDTNGGNNIVLRTFVSAHLNHRDRERDRDREHQLTGQAPPVPAANGLFPNVTVKNEIGNITGPSINENSKYAAGAMGIKKAGPPPGRKICGAIEVIGAGAQAVPTGSSPISVTPNTGSLQPPGPHVMRRPDMHGMGPPPPLPPSGPYGAPPPSFSMDYSNQSNEMHSIGFQSGPSGSSDYMGNRFDMNSVPAMENSNQFDNEANMYRDDTDERGRDYGFSRNAPNVGRVHMNRDYDGGYRGRQGPISNYRNDNYDKDRSRDKDRDGTRRRDRERSERDRDREKRRKT